MVQRMRGSVLVAPARSGSDRGRKSYFLPTRALLAILPIRPVGVHNGMGYCVGRGFEGRSQRRRYEGISPTGVCAFRARQQTCDRPLKPSQVLSHSVKADSGPNWQAGAWKAVDADHRNRVTLTENR